MVTDDHSVALLGFPCIFCAEQIVGNCEKHEEELCGVRALLGNSSTNSCSEPVCSRDK